MQPIALCFYNWFLPYVRKKLASKKIKAKTIQVKKIHFYPILVKNKRVLYFPCRHLKLILLFINKMMGIYSWEEKMRKFYATGCITFYLNNMLIQKKDRSINSSIAQLV